MGGADARPGFGSSLAVAPMSAAAPFARGSQDRAGRRDGPGGCCLIDRRTVAEQQVCSRGAAVLGQWCKAGVAEIVSGGTGVRERGMRLSAPMMADAEPAMSQGVPSIGNGAVVRA